MDKLHVLAAYLIANEKISGEDFVRLMKGEDVAPVCLEQPEENKESSAE